MVSHGQSDRSCKERRRGERPFLQYALYKRSAMYFRSHGSINKRSCKLRALQRSIAAGLFRPKHHVEANERVRKLVRLIELEPIAGVRNLNPAYCSVLIKFDAMKQRHEELEQELREYLDRLGKVNLPEPRQVEIPVCYGGDSGRTWMNCELTQVDSLSR